MARIAAAVERVAEAERAQLALWSPLAIACGIFGWFALPAGTDWMALVCLALAGGTALLALPRDGGRGARAAGMACLLVAVGCVLPWAKATMIGDTVLARPATVTTEAIIVNVEVMAGRGIARLLVHAVGRPDLPTSMRVNVAVADMPVDGPLRRGDRLRLRARLMPPAPPVLPGGYDYARRAWFDGIGATGRVLPPLTVVARGANGGATIRERLSAHVAAQLGGQPGALAVTMATGDRGRISSEVEDAMRQAGLTHLLSISGLHVTALIGGVIVLVYRLLALSTRLALRWPLMLVSAGAGAAAGIGYTLLTGAEVPTIRSCITALLVMAGLALGREAISLRLLACGALVVMILWPDAVIGPSFQLSFTAVAAIVSLYEYPRARAFLEARDEAAWKRPLRMLGGLFFSGVVVEIALMPIALYHFHKAGLLGTFANMLAIPLTEMVVMPAEALALALDTVGLGAPAWWVVGQALRLLLAVAHFIAAENRATVLMPAVPPLAFALAMSGIYWLMLWRTRLRWLGLPIAAFGLAGYALAPVPDVMVSADGHHVALRTPDGRVALLRDKAGDYMRSRFAEEGAFAGDMGAIMDLPGTRCSADFCAADLWAGHHRYRLLMARTRLNVPWQALATQCAAADIVIADRRLPRGCTPRWLKLDRSELTRSGGATISLAAGLVNRSRDPRDEHPWVRYIRSSPRAKGGKE